MLATSIKLPTSEEIKKLSLADIAIAAGLADDFRDRLREYVHVDPYCMPDPFTDKDDCNYSVILDREYPNRVIALLANKKGDASSTSMVCNTGRATCQVVDIKTRCSCDQARANAKGN